MKTDMEKLPTHLTKEMILKYCNFLNMNEKAKRAFLSMYKKIIDKWAHPRDWYRHENKKINISPTGNQTSTEYWCLWSSINRIKLPVDFLKNSLIHYANRILRFVASDYDKFEVVLGSLGKSFSNDYVKKLNSIFLKLCLFKGANTIKEILPSDIQQAKNESLFNANYYYSFAENCLYFMGYISSPAKKSQHKVRGKFNEKWSSNMIDILKQFSYDLRTSKVGERQLKQKVFDLNIFANWLCEVANITKIENLKMLSRELWENYINYILDMETIGSKCKNARLLSVKQLIEWMNVKRTEYIAQGFIVSSCDYSIVQNVESENNLAFESRECGEIILNYLMNDFKTNIPQEMFIREALIIAANSGMRLSEVRRIAYDSIYPDKEEQIDKIILEYEDKLGQVNRPVYFTKDGYEAIKRVEKLREEYQMLVKRYDARMGKKYIPLFEYRGINPLGSYSVYKFISKIKVNLGLVNEDGSPKKGGFHAFRHFFAMAVFRESGFNIGVVRYLLGHKSYEMPLKYLEEEKEKVLKVLREETKKSDKMIAGKGIDMIVDLIIDNSENKKYLTFLKILRSKSHLSELMNNITMVKLTLGFCLKPCENKNKCFKCNKFLIDSNEKEELMKFTSDFFNFICYKISMFTSKEEALNNIVIKNDIADLYILIDELKILGVDFIKSYKY